ncbi:MAG: helix-turn-helix domain-containing protein [Candidatus Pacebacteria bacterium]|nr:helix-turn-helix domain-containing protein [Candidatus Paceibacterota bacterium]
MENKNTQLKLQLQSFGFSEKETDVYIALLELGKGTVSKISLQAGINRTTGYDILGSLVSKKLVTVSGKEPKQEHSAEPPTAITEYLKRRVSETETYIKEAEKILPELTLLHTIENRPKIRFYEGLEGLQYVYEDTLTSSETIRAYAAPDDVQRTLPNYFPDYFKRRAKKGIPIRAIFPRTPTAEERQSHDIEEKRDTAFVPADKYYFSPEINIYDNKIMIASWREKLGITIESEEIADAMKKIFELAWAEAKRLDAETKK